MEKHSGGFLHLFAAPALWSPTAFLQPPFKLLLGGEKGKGGGGGEKKGGVEEWRTLSGAARGKDAARTADILPGAAEESGGG